MPTAGNDTLAFSDLVARLADGAPGELAAVTPNNRLAQCLAAAVAARHLAAGRHSWPAPDVLTLGAWLERVHEDARFDDSGEPVPALLGPDAERLGWEDAISRDPGRPVLVGGAALAREAHAAWGLAHEWGIEGALGAWEGSADAQAFAGWALAWREESARRGWTDAARLPALLPALLARPGVRRPATLVAYAFDLPTPAQRRLFDACRAAGIAVAHAGPPRHEGRAVVVAADSPKRELELAARWARARLESAPAGRLPRVGVVVPDLAQRRELVARVFSRVFEPMGRAAGAPVHDLSLGRALADYPLADFALGVVAIAAGPVPFERASRLLRSPFLGGAEGEAGPRARLDATLRRAAPPTLDLAALLAAVRTATGEGPGRRAPRCPALEARLAELAALAPPPRLAPPSAWAGHFARQLAAAGFPGARPLDSAEHQVHAKWLEALGRLGALGAVVATVTGEAARRHLRQLCTETVFQPESGEAPVQVLGLLESVGLDFDALWVAGLTDDAWPQSPRPNPFVPVALQRRAGVPQASAEASLELDARITQGWARAAPEVVFSHALADSERALAASPMLAPFEAVGEADLALPPAGGLREALFAAGREPGAWEGLRDRNAPALEGESARGGTAVLADQAACPFRAFARHRLGAESLEKVEPGLDASDRGQLLHRVMARLWRELGSQAALLDADPDRLVALAGEAARVAVARLREERPGRLDGRFAQLERERLAAAALAWLAIDRDRPPFTVAMREEAIVLQTGGLELRGRIDRLDRLEAGGVAVIDYKTGTPRVAGWLGGRPDDPQLPLYALAAGDDVAAVAFACLRKGRMGFDGLAREAGLLPGVGPVDKHPGAGKHHASWAQLLAAWREATRALAQAFVAGEAAVDPKQPFATCRHCDLAALCRVRGRGLVGDDEPAAGAAEEPCAGARPSTPPSASAPWIPRARSSSRRRRAPARRACSSSATCGCSRACAARRRSSPSRSRARPRAR